MNTALHSPLARTRPVFRRWCAGAVLSLTAALVPPAHADSPSGVSPNAVSLPTGPGSIRGLGEDFEPTLNTGVAKYSIPIEAPRGPNGFAPDKLDLEYDGGSGNGILGFGWQLLVPNVRRRDFKPLPRYVDGPNGIDDDRDGEVDETDETDFFVSETTDNALSLVPREDGFYFSQREEDFIRYRRDGEAWEGALPSGQVMRFGDTEDSRILHPDTGAIYYWGISEKRDPDGNTVRYTYTRFDDWENANQLYLSKIEYGAGSPPWDNFHFIVYEYEDRTDIIENCRPGFCLRTAKRLKTILIGTQGPSLPGHQEGDFNGDGTTDYLNRRYDLTYEKDPHWSLLTTVTLVGADGVSAMPPMRMDYTTCKLDDVADATPYTIGVENPPIRLFDNPDVEVSELNGDGFPDLLRTNPATGQHLAYLNMGEMPGTPRRIRWSDATPIGGDQRAWNVSLSADEGLNVSLADFDGDGRSDLVYRAGRYDMYYFPNEPSPIDGTVAWGERRRMNLYPGESAPPSPGFDDDVIRADLNDDKRGDILQAVDATSVVQMRVWMNLGGQRFARPYTFDTDMCCTLSQQGVHYVDFNGDGIPDFLRISVQGIEAAPGLGYGYLGEPIFYDIPDMFLNDYQRARAEFIDLTGDGLPELVVEHAAPNEVWYWLNLGNYTMDHRRVITGIPDLFSDSLPEVRWADLNGNGSTDLIYSDTPVEPPMRVIELGELLCCVPSPHLISSIENGLGRRTNISYKSSGSFAQADRDADRIWPDPIPVVYDVVDHVADYDSLGNEYIKRFAYHDGYYHPGLQRFAGFAEVLIADEGDPTIPTEIIRHAFDIGKTHYEMLGTLLAESHESLDGGIYFEERNTWTPHTLYTGVNGIDVIFPRLDATRRLIYERDPAPPIETLTEYAYDAFGNRTEVKEYGVVEGDNLAAGNDERLTFTEFAVNQEAWLVRSPAREELRSLDGAVIARTEYYYDDESFSGANFGLIETGHETLIRKWTDPANPEAHIAAMRANYDAFGNAIHLFDPLARVDAGLPDAATGHYRSITYDEAFRAYPVAEAIHVGNGAADLELLAGYDPGLGVVTSSTDYNGHVTTYAYDPFGRLLRTWRPGDTEDFPTLEYVYAPAVPFGAAGFVNYVETRLLDTNPGTASSHEDHYHRTREFMDGLGRRLMTKQETASNPEDGSPRVSVTYAAAFNGRGGVRAVLQPHFVSGGGDLDQLLDFQDITAPDWTGIFHEEGTAVEHPLESAPKSTYTYDELQRERAVTYPDGTVNEKRYARLATRVYDAFDLDNASPYFDTPVMHHDDGLGRLVQVDEIVGLTDAGLPAAEQSTWSTRYSYRADGLLLRIRDAQDNEKWYEYDGLQRMLLLNDYNRGEMRYAYDDAGNLVESTDAKGQRITYTYDGANRARTKDYHDSAEPYSAGLEYDPLQPLTPDNRPDVAWFYDAPEGPVPYHGGQTALPENTAGRLAYSWDLAGESHLSYDARGNIAWTALMRPDPATGAAAWYATTNVYDVQDRLAELHYPDGDRAIYSYNEGGQVAGVLGGDSLHPDAAPYLFRAEDFSPSNQRTRVVYGNGIESSWAYDSRLRLARVTATPAVAPGAFLLDYRYSYDDASNLTAVTDERPESVLPAGDTRRNSQQFAYDDRYRLVHASFSLAGPGQPYEEQGFINYRYDRIGNLLAQESPITQEERGQSITNLGELEYGGALGASGRIGRSTADPGPHALTRAVSADATRVFEYDANGNVTRLDSLRLTYDFEDQLVTAQDDTFLVSYAYDASGSRSSKKVWNKDAEGNVLATLSDAVTYVDKTFEVRMHGQPVKLVFDGEQRVARITGTLDTTGQRTQWLRLRPGWNLFSLVLDAPDAASQILDGPAPGVEALLVVDNASGEAVEADSSTPIPGGSILWAYTTAATTIPVTGSLDASSAGETIETGFAAPRTLDTVSVATYAGAAQGPVWTFDAMNQSWHFRAGPQLPSVNDLPEVLSPGCPVYVHLDAPATLTLPPASRGILYYHADLVESATLVTDGAGTVIEETAYYPYGAPRNQYRDSDAPENPYQFAQKERDRETNLHYFEARYLASPLARFLQVDPAVVRVPEAALMDPQALQAYGYGRGNPLTYRDPAGRFLKTALGQAKLRELNPFGNSVSANSGLSLAERRARVFGDLKIPKGGSLPKGQTTVKSVIMKALSEDRSEISEANTALASIAQMAENIAKLAGDGKKSKLNASAFLNLLTKDRKIGGAVPDGASLTEGGRIVLTSDQFIDKFVSKDFAKVLDTVDFDKKFEELSGIANKALKRQGFDFKTEDVNKFIDKYLDTTAGDVSDSDGDGIPNTADNVGSGSDEDKDDDSSK